MVNQDSGRNRKIILIVALALIVISILSLISFQFEQVFRQSESHNYAYEIDLSFTTPIENVTLFLPVPEQNGTPVLVQSLVNGTGYGVPADWTLSIVEQNGTPMLEITAPRMVPEYQPNPIPIEPGESPVPTTLLSGTEYSGTTPVLVPVHLVATASQNVTIDTRDPVGHEPVFNPDGQFIPVPGTGTGGPYAGRRFVHPVPVYIWYTSDRPVKFSFWIRIEGVNSIWQGGWRSNTYSDMVLQELGNDTKGWIETEATIVAGEGVYY